jgi:hypothetical protein
VVHQDATRSHGGHLTAVGRDGEFVLVLTQTQCNEIASGTEVGDRLLLDEGDSVKSRQRCVSPDPDVQGESGLGDRAGHRSALVAETDEADVGDIGSHSRHG